MGWVVIMSPLPDAPSKSPRVYKNLKTKTLEDVTFSNVEATGDPLSIEIHNEDELRRLVLVQLARLTVKSEWTGLLTGSTTTFPLLAPDGTQGAPSYSFASDTNTGMFLVSGDNLSFAAAGGERLRVSATGLQAIPDGTASVPGISFSGDTQTGFYQPATNNVAIATDASERLRVGDAGQIGIAGANYGTDGQVLTSKGASAAVEWADASGGGMEAPAPQGSYPYQLAGGQYCSRSNPEDFDLETVYWYCFVSSQTGTVSELSIYNGNVSAAGKTMTVGIYSTTATGYPDTKLTEGSFPLTSTGNVSDSSLTGSASLERGKTYWVGFRHDATSNHLFSGVQQNASRSYYSSTPYVGPAPVADMASSNDTEVSYLWEDSASTLPTTATVANMTPINTKGPLLVGVKT